MNEGRRERICAAAVRWIAVSGLAAAAAAWFVAGYLPIYPDEIAYRILTSRGFTDGLTVMNVYPTCVRSFSASMPYSWVPAKAAAFVLYGMVEAPTTLRPIGLGTVGVAFALTVALFSTGTSPSTGRTGLRWSNATVVVLLIASTGLIPLSLVMTRPEALVLVLVLALAYLQTRVAAMQRIESARWWVPPTFFLLSTLLYSLHPKTLFLAPFVLHVGWKISRRILPRWAVYLSTGVLLACMVDAYLFWRVSYACPENPAIHAYFSSLRVDPALLASDAPAFFQQAWANIASSSSYISHAGYHASYPIDWLPRPPGKRVGGLEKLANLAVLLTSIWLLVSLVVCLVMDTWRFVRRPGSVAAENAMALTIVIAVLGYAMFNSSKHFYEVAFIWPMLGVAYALQLRGKRAEASAGVRAYTAALGITVIASAAASVNSFGREFIVEGFMGPGISIPRFSRQEVARQIEVLAEKCRIPRDANGHFIVLDDVSYTYFSRTRSPVLITWLLTGTEQVDKFQYLRAMDSSGVITRCGYLPEELKRNSVRAGFTPGYGGVADGELDLCCVAKQRLGEKEGG